MQARAAIFAWVEMVDRRKRVRRLMNRLIVGKDGQLLEEAWAVWSDHCRSRGWEEVQALLKQREDVIEEQASRLEEVEAKLELLHQRGEELGMASAKRMVQMWQNKVGTGFSEDEAQLGAKRRAVNTTITLHVFVSPLTTTILTSSLRSSIFFLQCLINVLQAWKTYAKTEIEDRVKMNRFLSRWTNQSLSRCYDAWKNYAKEEIRCRTVVAKFLKRWISQCLTKCFLAWAFDLREGKRERIVVEKFRKRFMNQCVGRAWNSWSVYVGERKWLRR
ncbi:hypothetical protein TL16_g12603 [Triparma laevis f. inornata]|uniref:Sfi1 spindle body domain-containing protein n=1 Tax=Triparma laevis f. inornata TaxID=1714386 RepID=A0A9W7BMG5_9STRA|nr:hypothetical protein TL16_g12603 [Triparma laevis f. inornata]